MKNCKKIRTFYLLYKLIVKDIWVKEKEMALALGRSGRGSTFSSASRQLTSMYDQKVSFRPRLVLNNYRGFETTAYFCKRTGKYGSAHVYWKLYNKKLNSEISSASYLAGNYDFFITTRRDSIDLESVGLDICEETKFYDPLYTIPTGWNHTMRDCVKRFFKEDFVKRKLPRVTHDHLNWEDLDWRIYKAARENLRRPIKQISDDVHSNAFTVKKHLLDVVVPSCTVAHFFFPRGYDYYDKIFMHMNSEYEYSISAALNKFPCTTYIYPLGEKMICIIFHDGIRNILDLTKKLEDKGLIDDLILSTPLASIF